MSVPSTAAAAARPPSGAPWQHRPVVAGARLQARTTGALYVVGAGLDAVVAATRPPGADVPALLAAAAVALLLGVSLAVIGTGLPHRAMHLLVGLATILITLVVLHSGGGVAAVALASLYVFVACDAFFFLSVAAATAQLVAAAACALLALGAAPGVGRGPALVVAGVTVAVGCTVGKLVRLAADVELDLVTGLVNRRCLDRQLPLAVEQAGRAHRPLTLARLHVEHAWLLAGPVPDPDGDGLLRHLADAWSGRLAPDHMLARLGGHQLALLLPAMDTAAACEVVDALRATSPEVSVTVGIAERRAGEPAWRLLARAEATARAAHHHCPGRTRVDDTEPDELVDQLRRSVLQGSIDVHLQPVLSLVDRRLVAVQAEASWTPPGGDQARSERLLAMAEAHGLAVELGEVVLTAAAEQARTLCGALRQPLELWLRVSGRNLLDDAFIKRVRAVLEQCAWPPERLVLQLRECVLGADSDEAVVVLRELRAIGVRVALVDFGTGGSALGALGALPIDVLQLDPSLLDQLADEPGPPPVLAAVAALGAALHLTVVADGVQTEQQASRLTALGYALALGPLYCAPMTGPALLQHLALTGLPYQRLAQDPAARARSVPVT